MGFKRSIAIAVVLGLIMAGMTGLMLVNHFGEVARARSLVAHTNAVIDQTRSILGLVVDAETSQRGFLITQNEDYLVPYQEAADALPEASAELIAMTADNPTQQIRVRQLVDSAAQRMRIIQRTLAPAKATGDFAVAREAVVSGAGLTVMANLRRQADRIITIEQSYLAQRTAAAAHEERTNLAIGVGVAAFALLGLVGGIIALAGSNRDLTRAMEETRVSRAAQARTEALTAAFFNNVPDYLIVLDTVDGDAFTVADLNPAFERVLNVKAEDVRGRPLADLLSAPVADALTVHYRRVLTSDRPVLTRNQIPAPRDGPRTWESILAPVRDGDSAARRIIGSIRDITERVRAEDRLRGSQRMEAVGQLTGGVAHDFNNLLQVIRGNLELMESRLPEDPRLHERLKNALYGVDRAGQLTRQLLAFARRQPLEPRPINLGRLVGDMADMLRRTLGESVEVETVVAGGLWNTIADPAQVESAVLNLSINARDAMPDGGRLTIELTNASLDDNYVRGVEDVAAGQYVLLAVSDTGEGMAADIVAKVFEPFFTTKSEGKGTGLGLSMVYGFVKQSGGHIQIYSEPGQGTTVKIYLPRTRQSEAQAVPAAAVVPDGDGEIILVVEDDEAVRLGAVGLLEDLGYRCLEAADFSGALALLVAHPEIDLVFSDVVMPGALKTREFSAQAKALRPDTPILFTSGYTENAIVHHGRLDDGVSLLSKPYARADLSRKISLLLRQRARSDQSK